MIMTRHVEKSRSATQKIMGRTTQNGAGGNGMIEAVSFSAKASVSTAFNSMSGNQAASEYGSSDINIMGGVPVGDASTVDGYAREIQHNLSLIGAHCKGRLRDASLRGRDLHWRSDSRTHPYTLCVLLDSDPGACCWTPPRALDAGFPTGQIR